MNGDHYGNCDGSNNNLHLHLHPQRGSPIGLTLKKSTSLINLVQMTLSQERQHKKLDKLKASNFPAALLQIGSWKFLCKETLQRISRNEGDLVAKLYYTKKKLVWEFLDGPLKNKIEIQWSEISAIKSFTYEGQPGRLEIELNQPPQYGREINPQPRKHTQWAQTTDFTGGQAPMCRRHSVIFPPGVLDKQYEKLLQCDERLFSLSQQPFPFHNHPYFFHDPNAYLDYSNTKVNHGQQGHFLGDSGSNTPFSVMRWNERAIMHTNENQQRARIQFEGIPADHLLANYGPESWIPVQESERKMIIQESDGISGESGFQEWNSWAGGIPWETGMEGVGLDWTYN